ncbi:hypothetical protein KKH3_14140 [Pectobacterium actinidiae]|nr:hypothetical protein KKH3_14140 [Pectobacterium actinidiae]
MVKYNYLMKSASFYSVLARFVLKIMPHLFYYYPSKQDQIILNYYVCVL